MKKLDSVYEMAVEHTKQKVCGDVKHFLQDKEELLLFEEYEAARKHYVERIWFDVWVNLASSQVSRAEKKQYLSKRGYEVEGVERKLINKLFRDEIKSYRPFPVHEWLHEIFSDKTEQWAAFYNEAKEDYRRQLQIQAMNKMKKECQSEISETIADLVISQQHLFYLQTRKMIADQLDKDIQTKVKYKKVDPYSIEEPLISQGPFQHHDYFTISDFLDEMTGSIQKILNWNHYEYLYETYYDVYEAKIYQFLSKVVPEKIKPLFPHEVMSRYDEKVFEYALLDVCSDYIVDLCETFCAYLTDELMGDLMKLAQIPFTEEIHQKFFIEDMKLREQRKVEEKERIQRQKEEEARILNEIFEMEYSPPEGRNIRYILHFGETNTGKTYQALQRMKQAPSGLYLAPLRLLALEVYDFLNENGTPCSLKTGEEERTTPGGSHISCTVEMFHERDFYHVVVIDEAQMISDKDRGYSWYKAITKVQADEVHIIASLNARDMLTRLLGSAEMEIIEYKREIPLEVEKKEFKIKYVKKGDALICFSRKRVLETASRLQNDGHNVSMIYGSMPPETRKKQVLRFINGEADIVVATDAIGMGLNLPIRRIVFLENHKFDGTGRRLLSSQEVKQIAGRAGRKGLYTVGKVAFTEDIKKMETLLFQEDVPLHTFTIAPTSHVFERFQKYYRDLQTFFMLWGKFKNPKGTKKASLSEEKELYQLIQGTELEARLSLTDLYGLLHLPFSTREPDLIRQWKKTVESIVAGRELPEPKIKKRTLEELELCYKAVGLHLLFLYRLNRQTNALYWERIREEISDLIHEKLKTEVKKMRKRCRQCNKALPWEHQYQICNSCYEMKHREHEYF